LIEIPDNIKNVLNIIPVGSIDQVIENALVQSPQEISVIDASKISNASETDIVDKTNISH
jgi:predicted ATP-dependent protease